MTIVDSMRGKAMLSYLPSYYETSRIVRSIAQTEGMELDQYFAVVNGVLDQFFVRKADWGLDKWEIERGLPLAHDQSIAERRDRIVSRIRGTGTATIRVVKEVAESYDNGSVEVVEHYPSYEVTIRFVDTRGVPSNLEDLKAAVYAVLPAHLAVTYSFSYLNWSELDLAGINWNVLDAQNLTWDQFEVLTP